MGLVLCVVERCVTQRRVETCRRAGVSSTRYEERFWHAAVKYAHAISCKAFFYTSGGSGFTKARRFASNPHAPQRPKAAEFILKETPKLTRVHY